MQIGSRATFHYRTKGAIWSNLLVNEPIWIKKVKRSFNDFYGRIRKARNDTGLAKSCPSSSKLDFLKTRKMDREWVSGVV